MGGPADRAEGNERDPRSGLRDYVAWHRHYDDPESPLSLRLARVQAEIDRFLDERAPDPVRVVSLCSGDGRDLLDVLARRGDAGRVTAVLLEILPDLVDAARNRATALGLDDVEVRRVDAAHTDAYREVPPADLLIVSGVMGNLDDEDLASLIGFCGALTGHGSRVIWNRAHTPPDPGDHIRRCFDRAGFRAVAVHERIGGTEMRVGVEESIEGPRDRDARRRLFTFQK